MTGASPRILKREGGGIQTQGWKPIPICHDVRCARPRCDTFVAVNNVKSHENSKKEHFRPKMRHVQQYSRLKVEIKPLLLESLGPGPPTPRWRRPWQMAGCTGHRWIRVQTHPHQKRTLLPAAPSEIASVAPHPHSSNLTLRNR